MYSEVIEDWFLSELSKSENFDLSWDLNPRLLDCYSDALPKLHRPYLPSEGNF